MNIKCPFCNFETDIPIPGKIHECKGECYSTYSFLKLTDDIIRVKMRLVEIFFLDYGDTTRATPAEIDVHCEFSIIPAPDSADSIIFAREKRPSLDEIDDLRNAVLDDAVSNFDMFDRLMSSLDRYKRDQSNGATTAKLLSDIKVVEALVSIIREDLERKDEHSTDKQAGD